MTFTATCPACDQMMTPDASCLPFIVDEAGKKFERVRYQPEEYHMCWDCGTAPGKFHHMNCDQERCPKCGGQLLSCGMGGKHHVPGDYLGGEWVEVTE